MPKRIALICRACGVERGSDQWTHPTYCPECWRTYQRNRWNGLPGFPGRTNVWVDQLPERDCQHCGQSFRPKLDRPDRPAAYCSRRCKDKAKNVKLKAERLAAKPTDRCCVYCGVTLPQKMRTDALFCSTRCNERAHALPRSLRANTDQGEEIGSERLAIFERDGWRCGHCGEPVDPTLRYPEPMCSSLDHIVPVSAGGATDPSNLRLTHLVCNVSIRNIGAVRAALLRGSS